LRPIWWFREWRMSLKRRWILFVAAGVSASCRAPSASAPEIEVVFAAESDPGLRLSNVRVAIDGRSAGETDSNGLLRTTIDGKHGQRFKVEHDCPHGHVPPSAPKFLRLRSFDPVAESQSDALRITLRCQPEERHAVFIVRAKNGAELPVLLNGESVARTNRSGVAHFSTSARPGTDFIVELDTGSRPQLSPQRPKHLRTLPDANEIFVVNQSFELRKAPRRRGPQRTRITKIE